MEWIKNAVPEMKNSEIREKFDEVDKILEQYENRILALQIKVHKLEDRDKKRSWWFW